MSEHRQTITRLKDDSRNTFLHLAGRLPPPNKLTQVSGAALQMQRELQWFKEVEKFSKPTDLEWQNAADEVPTTVFSKEHRKLVVEGEKWMKDTANSCTTPATLIATVVFAAAITVPGGNNNADGFPIFSKEFAFNVFVVFDAISLFMSTTSLLMFLSILTSHYAEGDFLFVLPNRLIIGLVTLFLSITTMVVAFSCALYLVLVFGHNDTWAVKKVGPPGLIEATNCSEETPAMVFTREHEDLRAKGEKWMKDTANSCTIPAALIATVAFAAAITVPGGNNNDSGYPIFSHKVAFNVFAVSDAISLFTSATSLLMFLSILTSRFAEKDFLKVLPTRLIIGLFTLFLSITTMVVAFSCTLYLVFGQNKAGILIVVAALACLPITSFITLQFPLLVALTSSTYGKSIFGKQNDKVIY
ncbi:hypothetical protein Vadar_015925 [Vaccinium darrowii]|uniref:Uncharacterized protein n=1 Tax=Vaccinium darrowii TaxID=229202 RepID=A0ACB7YDY5_9ERIC|nr:hypothetical protein Vadar_015925 [Vaccinium darrowii]